MFSVGNTDWGFPQMLALRELLDSNRGFIVDGAVLVEARIKVVKGRGAAWGEEAYVALWLHWAQPLRTADRHTDVTNRGGGGGGGTVTMIVREPRAMWA